MQKFFHLRLHTEYSINDSILRIADVIQLAKQNNLDALAITDFHNMFGMVKFYSACRKNSIKPILGAELSVIRDTKVSFSGDTSTQDLTKFHASSDNNPISHKNIHEYSYRIIVLIKNNLGLHELNQLITNSYLNNKLYDKPYIAESELLNNNQKYNGIIILSGGIYGDITQLILQNKLELATKKAAMWQKHFGDNYYLELHRIINYPNIESIVDNTILIANELGIAVVATNPIYFANSADYMAHEVRVCIANSERIDDSSRVSSFYPDQSFLPTEIMLQKFADIPSAIQNTVETGLKIQVPPFIEKGEKIKVNTDTSEYLERA